MIENIKDKISPYEQACRIKMKCQMLCLPLPVNFRIDEENQEVILLPILDKDIEKFEIPEYITVVDDWAFDNCYRLQEVIIPDSVIRIGEGAFHNCISLQSVKLPSSLTMIPDQAFAGCTSLEKVEIGSGVIEVGNWAFSGTIISRNMLPDTIEVVSKMAFEKY